MIVDNNNNNNTCTYADIRESNGGRPILHASISAKWIIRFDRAQSSLTEALNLIHNRKGDLPRIAIVTGGSGNRPYPVSVWFVAKCRSCRFSR